MNISPRIFNVILVSLVLCMLYWISIQNNTAQESPENSATATEESTAVPNGDITALEPNETETAETDTEPPAEEHDEHDEHDGHEHGDEEKPMLPPILKVEKTTETTITLTVPQADAVAHFNSNDYAVWYKTEKSDWTRTTAADVVGTVTADGTLVTIEITGLADNTLYDFALTLTPQIGEGWTDVEASAIIVTERTLKEIPFNYQGLITLLVFVVVVFGSYWLGNVIAKRSRLPEHGFKIFIVLLAFFGGFAALVPVFFGWKQPTLGIDLQGGVVLIYDAKPIQGMKMQDPNAPDSGGFDMDLLTKAISRRINPGGVKEISITKLGSGSAAQVQIVIPNAEKPEVDRIERVVSESGALTFRILASRIYKEDEKIIERGLTESGRDILDADGKLLARWVPIYDSQKSSFFDETGQLNRNFVFRPRGDNTECLVKYDDKVDITGEHLTNVYRGNSNAVPCVSFSFNAIGANKFGRLTKNNLPDSVEPDRIYRSLGIVLNDYLYSAPRIKSMIRESGIIEFSQGQTVAARQKVQQDISDLISVLQAGALPAELSKEPASRMQIGATLGNDTIQKAKWSLITAACLTVVFMIFYYRLAGCVASFCVITNTVLIFAAMLAFKAAFTLPGLAGFVLTIGMAVDANILIFERIREELAGGASLKMAVRNGYGKAFSAIFDSNLTTIIAGCILFAVGTEQVKGFAVTLVLGISLNLFTAIFCARVLMEVLSAQRWVKTFSMGQLFKRPNINFLGARYVCVAFSSVLIFVGLAAVYQRGTTLLDIDFVGGVSVEAVFVQSQNDTEIRTKLFAKDKTIEGEENRLNDLAVQNVHMDVDDIGQEVLKNTHYIITSSIPQVKDKEVLPDAYLDTVRNILKETFGDALEYCRLDYTVQSTTPVADYVETTVSLERFPKTNHDALASEVGAVIKKAVEKGVIAVELSAPTITRDGFEAGNQDAFEDWTITFRASQKDAEAILADWKTEMDGTPNFPTSTTVGGSVARNTRIQGAAAILASLVCMAIYITVRFSRWFYGMVAILGLLHVVLIVLGLLALSRWCVFPALKIEEFKIGLPVVAAFLTIIGYAINDTIILFDRIRENLGKATVLTGSMINLAINQTLSRTVLTSLTTFLTAFILYWFGGSGIHTFAFAITVGVLFGTYSTICICSSLLYWVAATNDLQTTETTNETW